MAVYTTIDNPELYFQVKLYSGTGSAQSITLDGSENMQPDLVWLKRRDGTGAHRLCDAVRGATKLLQASAGDAEQTDSDTLTSFDSDGFTLGADSSDYKINQSGQTMVAWNWKESATAGFDIVSYTGTGSSTDVSHSLSAVPELIFTKERSGTQWWFVYSANAGAGAQKALHLNESQAVSSQATAYDATPTSSVINYGADGGVNGSSDTYIAYLFRSIQGFSKVTGFYIANGNVNGPYVHLGFTPAFVIFKKLNGASDWQVVDDKRVGHNPDQNYFNANASLAEQTGDIIDLVSNGFKIRGDNSKGWNKSGDHYLYIAFAKAPFVNSKGVPCNAR